MQPDKRLIQADGVDGLRRPPVPHRLREVRAVPQPGGSVTDPDAGGLQEGFMPVAERMPTQPLPVQAELLQGLAHRVPRHPQGRDREQAPVITGLGDSGPHHIQCAGRQADGAATVPGLRRGHHPVPRQGAAHRQHPRLHIHIIDSEGDGLTDPQPRQQAHLTDRVIRAGQRVDDPHAVLPPQMVLLPDRSLGHAGPRGEGERIDQLLLLGKREDQPEARVQADHRVRRPLRLRVIKPLTDETHINVGDLGVTPPQLQGPDPGLHRLHVPVLHAGAGFDAPDPCVGDDPEAGALHRPADRAAAVLRHQLQGPGGGLILIRAEGDVLAFRVDGDADEPLAPAGLPRTATGRAFESAAMAALLHQPVHHPTLGETDDSRGDETDPGETETALHRGAMGAVTAGIPTVGERGDPTGGVGVSFDEEDQDAEPHLTLQNSVFPVSPTSRVSETVCRGSWTRRGDTRRSSKSLHPTPDTFAHSVSQGGPPHAGWAPSRSRRDGGTTGLPRRGPVAPFTRLLPARSSTTAAQPPTPGREN